MKIKFNSQKYKKKFSQTNPGELFFKKTEFLEHYAISEADSVSKQICFVVCLDCSRHFIR